MKKIGLALKLLFLLLLLCFLGGSATVGWLFYRAMPDYAGSASLPGLNAPVHIVRDEHGVPHIFAENMEDAARALGYVHASERLFQMEMQRRAGQGRLSEVIGKDTLNIDKFVRALGLYRLAKTSAAALSPEAQRYFQAYTDGVNAWMDSHKDALPPEFLLLKVKPEPWQVADSVVWGKLMALQLSKNYTSEILKAQLSKTLKPEQIAALFAALPNNVPVTTDPVAPDLQQLKPAAQNFSTQITSNLGLLTGLSHAASNEWVIAGSRTDTGKPILANDPHLGLEAPILWYLARIVTPKLSLEGVTVPGLPIVLLGQNDHIAWGLTTTGSDVQDLFIETLDPKNPDHYLIPGGSERFTIQPETIRVKDAANVELEIRSTRHGPVLSDIDPDLIKLAGKDKIVALAFTALGAKDTTSEALMDIDRAQNWQDILSALKLYQAPPQNMVYADTSGNIGFINPGLVPIRKSGDGTLPVDGASGTSDWTGMIPLEKLPQLYNPKSGYIFNANNNVVGPQFPYFMGVDWEEPWRAERLQQFFATSGTQTMDTSTLMQADHVSLAARALLPRLLAIKPTNARASAAIKLLKAWDGTMDKSRPEPLIFDAWLYELHKHLLVEKTGRTLEEKGPYAATSLIYIFDHDPKNWCATDCAKEIAVALDDALEFVTQRDGTEMKNWHWGQEHFALLRHKFYAHVPLLSDWSELDVPSSGDFYTLDRGGSADVNPEKPFARSHAAGFRGIYDLSDPSKSRFMITTGESAHIFSAHYGDLVPLWNDVKSFPLTGTRDELKAKGFDELELKPAGR